jgi:hypothetical protein
MEFRGRLWPIVLATGCSNLNRVLPPFTHHMNILFVIIMRKQWKKIHRQDSRDPEEERENSTIVCLINIYLL